MLIMTLSTLLGKKLGSFLEVNQIFVQDSAWIGFNLYAGAVPIMMWSQKNWPQKLGTCE